MVLELTKVYRVASINKRTDILNIFCHKIGKIAEEYYIQSNPRSNMCVSHNDGNYDKETSLFKDAIVGLYAFLNC